MPSSFGGFSSYSLLKGSWVGLIFFFFFFDFIINGLKYSISESRVHVFLKKILIFCCDWKEKRIFVLRRNFLCNLTKSIVLTQNFNWVMPSHTESHQFSAEFMHYIACGIKLVATIVEVDTTWSSCIRLDWYFEPYSNSLIHNALCVVSLLQILEIYNGFQQIVTYSLLEVLSLYIYMDGFYFMANQHF